MAKRLFDILFALVALFVTAPLLLLAALAIRISSPGPVLYRARRAARGGGAFVMHKFRTMHHQKQTVDSAITAVSDPRIFRVGQVLRQLKIDELPQFLDVLRGEMSVVGPRPEDPRIVDEEYTEKERETLSVRPGLVSPGSIFNYTHGDSYLTGEDTERAYAENLLPIKLALERVYVRHASLGYDLRLIARTVATIVAIMLGRREFPDPPEMPEALRLLADDPGRAIGAPKLG